MAKSKHSAEWKIALVEKYLFGACSYKDVARANGITKASLGRRVLQYHEQGENGFVRRIGNKRYSKEAKEQCVEAVLSVKGSVNDIAAKYNISDKRVLRRWIKCCNANMGLKDYEPRQWAIWQRQTERQRWNSVWKLINIASVTTMLTRERYPDSMYPTAKCIPG